MKELHEPGPRRRVGRKAAVDRGARRERVAVELRRVRPVARSLLRPGTVVWARIPYVDRPGDSKARPAVVREVRGREVDVLPITSSTKASVRCSELYVPVDDWAAAGLTRPCLVCRRAVSVDVIDVTTVAGALVPADRARVLGT